MCGKEGRAEEMAHDRDFGIICSDACYDTAKKDIFYDHINPISREDTTPISPKPLAFAFVFIVKNGTVVVIVFRYSIVLGKKDCP